MNMNHFIDYQRVKSIMLTVTVLCMAVTAVACNQKPQKSATTTAEVKVDVPYNSVETMDSLMFFMCNPLWKEATLENFEKTFYTQSSGMIVRWTGKHGSKPNTMSNDQVYDEVIDELESYAENLSEGSTWDMVMAAEITRSCSNFRTAKLYCERYKSNELYRNEMRDWLSLSKAMRGFYIHLTRIANWQGSIAQLNAAHTLAAMTLFREKDYDLLHADADIADSGNTIDKTKTELLNKIDEACNFNVADDIIDPEELEEAINELRDSGKAVKQPLEAWLASRAKLVDALQIPESANADDLHGLFVLAQTWVTEYQCIEKTD